MKTTITEALAEVKTIGKRIEKKKEFIALYILRQEQVKDPLEKSGGSTKALTAELQSIGDLQERLIRIRAAIQQSNALTWLVIGDKQRSITDWLTWRKEVAPGEQKMLASLRAHIEQNRQQLRTRGVAVGNVSVDTKPTDVVVNLDEAQLAKSIERLEDMLGTLDGKLSLLNATTTIEIGD